MVRLDFEPRMSVLIRLRKMNVIFRIDRTDCSLLRTQEPTSPDSWRFDFEEELGSRTRISIYLVGIMKEHRYLRLRPAETRPLRFLVPGEKIC